MVRLNFSIEPTLFCPYITTENRPGQSVHENSIVFSSMRLKITVGPIDKYGLVVITGYYCRFLRVPSDSQGDSGRCRSDFDLTSFSVKLHRKILDTYFGFFFSGP